MNETQVAVAPGWRRLYVWAGVASACWSVEAVVNVMQYRTMVEQAGEESPALGPLFVMNFSSSLLWVPMTLMILWLSYRWPVTARARNTLVHFVSFTVVIVGRALAVVAFNEWVHWYPGSPPPLRDVLVMSFFNNVIFFVFVTGLAHAVFLSQAVRRSEALLVGARIDALTAQLQPHFLFNALNTIAARIHTQPDVAERMVVDLGGLLRHSVARDHSRLVPLDEELEIALAYLRIEEHRFADRLTVSIEVDDDVRDAFVPPFILQPLLENAVRHGLAPRIGKSRLVIRASTDGGDVRIDVVDDGVGLAADGSKFAADGVGLAAVGSEFAADGSEFPADSTGVGIANVAARLQGAYGPRASLTIAAGEPAGVVATVRVPGRVRAAEVTR